jgi:hypothetical protein
MAHRRTLPTRTAGQTATVEREARGFYRVVEWSQCEGDEIAWKLGPDAVDLDKTSDVASCFGKSERWSYGYATVIEDIIEAPNWGAVTKALTQADVAVYDPRDI